MPRHWDEISSDTGIGNPKKSTAEKGERYVKAVTEKNYRATDRIEEHPVTSVLKVVISR